MNINATYFCAFTDELGWPEVYITKLVQTVHVPGCPNAQFFVRFHTPIKVIVLCLFSFVLPFQRIHSVIAVAYSYLNKVI